MGMFKNQIVDQDEFHLESWDDSVEYHDDGFGDCIEFDAPAPLISVETITLDQLLDKFAMRGQGYLPVIGLDYYGQDCNHLYL